MTASDLVELAGRLDEASRRIGKMCHDLRPPRMSIPANPDDDDIFITTALREAASALRESFGAWTDIPTAKRFGRTLTSDAVEHLKAGTLLRFYSPDPWFEPGEHMPSCGEIVVFTGKVNNDYPRIGPHLEVSTIDGDVYPGGGWVYRLFQFVGEAASALRERIPLPADGGAREALSNLLALFDDYRDSDLSHADAHACLVRYPVWEAARLALHPSSRGEAEQK